MMQIPILVTNIGGGLDRFTDTATTLLSRDYKGLPHQTANAVLEIEEVDDYVLIRQATKSGYVKCKMRGVADMNYENSETRRGRVIDEGDTSMTITANGQPNVLEPWTWEIDGKRYRIRIRKLTPRECWRLMGFNDSDFDKASKVNSNTQLYKQAGNSIVVPVLEGIFRNILSCLNGETTIKAKDVKRQLTFSEVFNW